MKLLFKDFLGGGPVEHEDVSIDPDYPVRRWDDIAVLLHVDHATLTLIVRNDQQVWLVAGGIEHNPPKVIGTEGKLI